MQPRAPITRDLVLIGGGHAHIEVLRRFGMRPVPGVRVTLVSREIHTPYSGMLPGYLAGHYRFDQAHIDLGPLARYAGARLIHADVDGLDLLRGEVLCATRPPLDFDLLSLDSGSSPGLAVPGAAAHAIPVKPVSQFVARFEALRARVLAGEVRCIGVVGGGAGGVELLMALRHRLLGELDAAAGAALGLVLLTAGASVLATHGARAQALYRRALAAAGIEVLTAAEVVEVDAGGVSVADGRKVALDAVLWVTDAAAPGWPRAAGLAVDARGFVRVDAGLRSVSHPNVFAAGDIAAVEPHPRPKSGVFAVRQGPPLAANLRRALGNEPLVPFAPQRQFLSIISTGGKHAVAARGAFAVSGAWVWRWKDWIDRRFVERYTELPTMNAPSPGDEASADDMRCGGCGAKLGADTLHGALAALAPQAGDDVAIGLAEPDDAAVVRPPPGEVAVLSTDHFRSFIDDPWLFGRIAACHALADIYAMAATPRHALATVTLPYAAPGKMSADLKQVLAGALGIFDQTGTSLIGGHTGEGAELALGFTVHGYAREADLLRKRGAVAGDALILTRALGSGVLLAAAMRGQVRSRHLDAALATMATPQGPLARCLVEHGAHALTDVSGFGLAGHLLEMLRASGVGAELTLDTVPLYAGAEALAAAGVASTLYTDNRALERDIDCAPDLAERARYALLFDPQTAGGLLAAVPAARAVDCVAALIAAAAADACVIGYCTGTDPTQRRLRVC